MAELGRIGQKEHLPYALRRYFSNCGVSQRYIIGGPATRKPIDFKLLLANDENKTELCKLLLECWAAKPLHHSWRNVEQQW